MKSLFYFLTMLIFLLSLVSNSFAAPAPPVMSMSTTGKRVDIIWTTVAGATGYTLLYAPSPYAGPQTIQSKDMRTKTSFSANLWDGAAYYVAVTAYNTQEVSGYSNIELFTMGYFDDDNDGLTEAQGDCNDSDQSIYPGATDICGDNIDQDCSGSDKACLGHYTDKGDGTVKDNTTGLIWQQDTNISRDFNWQEAVDYCNNLSLGFSTNWRLPSLVELENIVDDSRIDPALDPIFGTPNVMLLSYWSSTTNKINDAGDSAWYVNFNYGIVNPAFKNTDYILVRCVR